MYLEAMSIGYAVPRTHFEASIHSIFRSAVNLRLNEGDTLLTLVTSKEADLPQGIRLDTPDDFTFKIFRADEPITCRDEILCFGSLTIELRRARRWKCDLPVLQADLMNPAVATAWRRVWQALNKRQIQLNAEIIAGDLFCSNERVCLNTARKSGGAMRNLVEATRRFDLTAAASIDTLIGLGTGLTPSGDDLLIGYLAGLWCAVWDKSERVQFVSDLGMALACLSRKTNDISRTYLYHASRGQVSSLLTNLAETICLGENSDRLLNTAETAMQVGHTSGMDAVTGLLIGLATWISPGTSCL